MSNKPEPEVANAVAAKTAITIAASPGIAAKKVHTVFSDLWKHPDKSWFVQPLGFLSSIVLFPSYLFCGMFTTIQESSLLDLKLSLDNDKQNKFVGLRFKRVIKDYSFKLEHSKIAADFVMRMKDSPHIKNMCASDASDDERLLMSMNFYQRYLSTAMSHELYMRNPVKYDMDHPLTGIVSKITVGAIGTTMLLLKLSPAADKLSETLNANNVKLRVELASTTTKEIFQILSWFKHRGAIMAVGVIANVGNVIMWGMEPRN